MGKLWIVATPIGNHGDLSPRAREILSQVSLVLAEDTRRSGKLLADCGISTAGFSSFHDHNEEQKVPQILERLSNGEEMALVSDAGTPLLSDPGFRLVRACRKAGIAVSPVPGPSAPITALSASGLPPLPFAFLGFAPRKESAQETFFLPYATLDLTVIFFERKDRLRSTLKTAFAVFGEREVCIARELTKTYEEFIYCTLSEFQSVDENLLGEITVIIAPPSHGMKRTTKESVLAMLTKELDAGEKPKVAAKNVQNYVSGWSVKDIYVLVSEINR